MKKINKKNIYYSFLIIILSVLILQLFVTYVLTNTKEFSFRAFEGIKAPLDGEHKGNLYQTL